VTPSPGVGDFDEDGTLEIVFVSVDKLGTKNWVSNVEIISADGTTWPGWPVSAPDMSESSPVIGDLNGDGSLDIAYGIGGIEADDAIYAWDVNGDVLPGFPIPIGGFVRATPTIIDFNRDGNVNLVAASWDAQIHVWDLLAPYDEAKTPWPTFRGNVNRTGVYDEFVKTSAPDARPLSLNQLNPAQPNPFNPRTEISFDLALPSSDVQLVLYDARGRRVRGLTAGDYDPGRHSVSWDGTDEQGSPVASGVYFARLAVDGVESGVRKLALVK
jgi:WD40 repeat protein